MRDARAPALPVRGLEGAAPGPAGPRPALSRVPLFVCAFEELPACVSREGSRCPEPVASLEPRGGCHGAAVPALLFALAGPGAAPGPSLRPPGPRLGEGRGGGSGRKESGKKTNRERNELHLESRAPQGLRWVAARACSSVSAGRR